MEYQKNTNIVKLIFKIKNIEKLALNVSKQMRYIKIKPDSYDKYNRCINTYQEGISYLFQSCGFLKSQFYNYSPSQNSKRFLINNLFVPSYKSFIELRQCLSTLEVEDGFSESITVLKNNTETINNSLYDVLNELEDIQ